MSGLYRPPLSRICRKIGRNTALRFWSTIEFAYVFAMWAVMMVGMMAPSAAPMILMYARMGRQGKLEGKPFAATGWFVTGYFLVWIGFSLVATLVQWAIELLGWRALATRSAESC
jgi:predicted metal-binding membrane protein